MSDVNDLPNELMQSAEILQETIQGGDDEDVLSDEEPDPDEEEA